MTTERKENFDFAGFQELIIEAVREGKPLLGKGGVFTPLIKYALEQASEGEIDEHLVTCKLQDEPNRRNGKSRKLMSSELGSFELETPRDRDGSFEPQLIKKRQTQLSESLEQRILGLFQVGMGYEEISNQVEELYDYSVSSGTIAKVTDRLLPVINEWRSRTLEKVYTIVFLDAMFFKVRENGAVVTKTLYNIMGINQAGRKEILGFYSDESEGSKFWLSVLTDLKMRGVDDILIACIDGLKGFPEAINTVFPKTEVQLCIVHQIRNSLKYVATKHQKEFMVDLKRVYKAPNKEVAESELLLLDKKWGQKYSIVLKSWTNNWEHLSAYFKFSPLIRKLIYTTNPIEGFHRQVRKYTKTKGAFTSLDALYKLVYCAIKNIQKKWNQPIQNWAETMSQLDVAFPNRINIELHF